MVDRYYGSYEAVSIQSYETETTDTSSSQSNSNIQVTKDMVEMLSCPEDHYLGSQSYSSHLNKITQVSDTAGSDFVTTAATENQEDDQDKERLEGKHQLMIVYSEGDINCALHFLIKSLSNPFAYDSVATVLVEENLHKHFVDCVLEYMRPLEPDVSAHQVFLETVDKLKELKMGTIRAKMDLPDVSPILVSDRRFSQLGGESTGVIWLSTFRSIREIIDICSNDIQRYATVSIWNESIEELYQLVASLKCSTFFFNCSNITLHPIAPSVAAGKNEACVFHGFHYESIKIENRMKIIVFPIGGHLTQSASQHHVTVDPVSHFKL